MYNRQKKQAVPIEEIEQMDCAGGFTPFDLVASKESVEAIAQYISQLDKKYADVLTLKFYYQYSDSEIAGLVQTSPENVRVRCTVVSVN
ncbi:MAG: sigma factor-like helix-turn-helix DNA-binding protein [Oscillospiraceae bacterium]